MRNDLPALRDERSWIQAVVADRLGVSRQTVNALETGRYDPSPPLALRLARLFDRPIEQLFHPDEDDAAREPARSGAPVRPR